MRSPIVLPALGVSGDPASGTPLSLGVVEANPDVSGESPLPVDAEAAAGDADALTTALAAPADSETPDDAIGSATILSTVELPDCA